MAITYHKHLLHTRQTVHDDTVKIKTMFFRCKTVTLPPMRFISLWFYIKYRRCSISWHLPTTIHRFAQNRPTIIITFLVYPPSIIFLLLRPYNPSNINKIAARDPHIIITGISLISGDFCHRSLFAIGIISHLWLCIFVTPNRGTVFCLEIYLLTSEKWFWLAVE